MLIEWQGDVELVNLLTAEDPFADQSAGIYDPHDPRDQHVLMPEYLAYSDRSSELAGHAVAWLTDAHLRRRVEGELLALKQRVAQGGASLRTADYITELMRPGVAGAHAA